MSFIRFAKNNAIELADGTRRIPVPDSSVDVLYTSHMLEHLDRREVRVFLAEARRVLRGGGILRVAVPDLALQVRRYMATGDADGFLEAIHLIRLKPSTYREKVLYLVVGGRHHHWMYDGLSLCRLLAQSGFVKPTVLEPGQTSIPDPGALDLSERCEESVYVEAVRE